MKAAIFYSPEPGMIWRDVINLPAEATILDALQRSRIQAEFPEIEDCRQLDVGIFGVKRPHEWTLSDGDRIEIYRPLSFNPMESRRRRAAHRKAGILKKKHLKPDRAKPREYTEHTGQGTFQGTT